MKRKDFIVAGLLILFIIVSRLLPHLPNVAPVAAAALVAGVYLKKHWALIIPLVGLFLSDLFLGFYNQTVMLAVYGSFVLIGGGSWFLKKHKRVSNVVTASLAASLLFFFITNIAVWLASDWYQHNLFGLLYAFELAVPFFRNTLMGDLFYTAVLFTCFETAVVFVKRKQLIKQN